MKYVKISKILTEKKKPQYKPEKASLARLLHSCNRGWAWEGRISVICSSIHSKASFPGVSKFYVSCLSLFLPSPIQSRVSPFSKKSFVKILIKNPIS